MNKRNARGNSLKYDKKASMTNQSSQCPAEALGKIWLLGDYDDSNWTEAARSLVTGVVGGESKGKTLLAKTTREPPHHRCFCVFANRITKSSHEMEGPLRMKSKVVQKALSNGFGHGVASRDPKAPSI